MPKGYKIKYNKKELERLYWKEELFQSEIAKKLNVSRGAIQSAMLRLNIPRRRKGEALHLAYITGRAHATKKKGPESPHWKGGRRNVKGYIYIYFPDHPKATKAGYILESHFVWEKANKKVLPKGFIIHHFNGIKKDNRPENLIALSRKSHSPALNIKEIQKRLRKVEAQLSQKELFRA